MLRTLMIVVPLLVAGAARGAGPAPETQTLFEANAGGYALYRIPGIVATRTGTLLAYCEARKHSRSDWGTIDVVLRRSADGGKSWSPARQIASPPADARKNPVAPARKDAPAGEFTINNPVAIADPATGAVHMLYCVEYARCFYLRSDDDGVTFSPPVEITPAFDRFRPEYDWKVLATGPGHGIRLAGGRLVVPVWLSTGQGQTAHRPSAVATIASDDGGRTWTRGAIVVADPSPSNPSESSAAELSDGRVMLNVRHESEPRLRGVAISPDGVSGWGPMRFDPALPDPVCFGSLLRVPGDPARLLFANLDNATGKERRNLSVRMSTDDGRTWPVGHAIEPGPSGYADLAVGPDGVVSCFYEAGSSAKGSTAPPTLKLARFRPDWLAAPKAD